MSTKYARRLNRMIPEQSLNYVPAGHLYALDGFEQAENKSTHNFADSIARLRRFQSSNCSASKKVVLKKKRLGQAFNAKGIAILAGFLIRLISHLKLSGA
jgi:hypothetical protein